MPRHFSHCMCTCVPALPVLFLGVMALLSGLPADAQSTKGTIAGRVTDSSGAVLQGAQIQLQSRDEKFASDTQGEFLISGLAPGDYKVKVSYVGFSDLEAGVTVKPVRPLTWMPK